MSSDAMVPSDAKSKLLPHRRIKPSCRLHDGSNTDCLTWGDTTLSCERTHTHIDDSVKMTLSQSSSNKRSDNSANGHFERTTVLRVTNKT